MSFIGWVFMLDKPKLEQMKRETCIAVNESEYKKILFELNKKIIGNKKLILTKLTNYQL